MIRKPVTSFPSTGEDGCRVFSLNILEHQSTLNHKLRYPQALTLYCTESRSLLSKRNSLWMQKVEKLSNISLGKGLACENFYLAKQGKKILSSSCFSLRLTLITVLWWERVIYFCFFKKLFIFLICFPKYKKEQTDPLFCYPCATAFEPVSLELEAWPGQSMRKEKSSLCHLEGIAQSQLTETMLRQQSVAGESHKYLSTKH